MVDIIGRIALQPAIVRPGEPVRVEVLDNNDTPLDVNHVQVSINGVPGAIQFLQFPTVGQRRLIVRARAATGETDRQIALLDVKGVPLEFPSLENRSDIAMIGVTQSPGRAMSANPQAQIRVETRRLTNTRAKAMTQQDKRVRPVPKATTRRAVGAVYDLTKVDLSGFFGKVVTAPSLEFEWDFGDGNTATTGTPVISHDYFASIDHTAGVGQFVVTCHVKHAGITVRRTLTIYSAYAICKGTGTVVPHVTADLFAHKRYNMLTGMFTVYNVEDKPIVLDRLSITPITDDGDAVALPRPFVNLDRPTTIVARSASMVSVSMSGASRCCMRERWGLSRYDAALSSTFQFRNGTRNHNRSRSRCPMSRPYSVSRGLGNWSRMRSRQLSTPRTQHRLPVTPCSIRRRVRWPSRWDPCETHA
jgi:hypothetical protein